MRTSVGPTKRRRRAAADLTFAVTSAEDLLRCVVMLHCDFTETVNVDGQDVEVWLKAPGAKPKPKRDRHLGTAFLVATAADAFLVTAGHVARRMTGEARLSYRRRNGRRGSLALAELLGRQRRHPWTFHRRADVAVARLVDPPASLRGRFLAADLLVAKESAPRGSLDLLAVGFPLGLASERQFAPIAKRVHAASAIVRFRGEEMPGPANFFLLDQPAMGGYSGAPVFVMPQRQLEAPARQRTIAARCVGLLSQTILDEAIGQFAAVVPSAVIRRLLTSRARKSATSAATGRSDH